jgi:membrane-bound lytic murein transglycosylase B
VPLFNDNSVKEILEQLLAFREERDWGQFHSPKNLAVLISIYSKSLMVLFILLAITTNTAGGTSSFNLPPNGKSLIQKIKVNGFSDEEVQKIFSDSRVTLYPEILDKKGHGINYMHKKFGLLTRTSVKRGQKVLQKNGLVFEEIENKYGVEKETIVAIYRLETNLGSYEGRYLVFNGLLTLAVLENRRSAWAEKELLNLLIFCKNNKKDPLSIKGSWAGAFGLCQFIPSSVIQYAIDGDGNGEVDLNNFSDAMASIANYLRSNGWVKNDPQKKKQAIWAYNHCDNYVKAVMAYASACKKLNR